MIIVINVPIYIYINGLQKYNCSDVVYSTYFNKHVDIINNYMRYWT